MEILVNQVDEQPVEIPVTTGETAFAVQPSTVQALGTASVESTIELPAVVENDSEK